MTNYHEYVIITVQKDKDLKEIKMVYINIKQDGKVETVDQFETYKEARKMVKEYNLSDSYNHYYLSQRSTNEWRLS